MNDNAIRLMVNKNNKKNYLSEYLMKKEKEINEKKMYDGNVFLSEWKMKFHSNSMKEFMSVIRSYNSLSEKKYDDIMTHYKKVLKNEKYDDKYFEYIFESFFPKPFDLTVEKMMMYDYMEKIMNDESKNNKITKMKNMNSYDFKNMNILIEDNGEDVEVLFIKKETGSVNNNLLFKYNWGSKRLFEELLGRMGLKRSELSKKIEDVNPIKGKNSNLTNEMINDVIDHIKMFYNKIMSEEIKYSKISISKNENKELFKRIQIISEKKKIENNDEFVDNEKIVKGYGELFELDLLLNVFDFIVNYIYVFLDFDNNIIIKIKKLYELFSYYLNDLGNKMNNDTNKLYLNIFGKRNEYYYMLGKKNFKNPVSNERYLLDILKIFQLLYKLQLSYSISNQDLVLSLLFHQYDYSVIMNKENGYFIRRDIENYYLIKSRILNNLKNDKLIKNGKIRYEVPYMLNDKIFLNIETEMNIPFDDIYNDLSMIIREEKNSIYKSLTAYMGDMSINGNLKKKGDRMKIEDMYGKLNIVDYNKWMNGMKGGKKGIDKKGKTLKIGDEVIDKLLEIQLYYNINEDNFDNMNNKKNSKNAYCSLYYGNNQYFLDTMVFGYSLYMSGTVFDRILICTTDVVYEQRKQLSRFYNRIFVVKSLDIDPLYFKSKNRWYGVFNKLYGFYLDEYEKIFLMDTDMLIQRSGEKNRYGSYCELDMLFDELNAPCGMCYDKNYITKTNEKIPEEMIDRYLNEYKSVVSAGIFLIKPSKSTFVEMVKRTNPELNGKIKGEIRGSYFPEESFLANYYKKSIYSLSIRYSYTPLWLDPKSDQLGVRELMRSIKEKDIVVIHYVGYKVWTNLYCPYWFILEDNKEIDKFKKKWCSIFEELQDLCMRKTTDMKVEGVNSLIHYCKWEEISFKT